MARHKISPKYHKTLTSTLLFHEFWMILFAKWGFFLNNFWPQQAGMGKKLSSIKERNQLSCHLPKPIEENRNLSNYSARIEHARVEESLSDLFVMESGFMNGVY